MMWYAYTIFYVMYENEVRCILVSGTRELLAHAATIAEFLLRACVHLESRRALR